MWQVIDTNAENLRGSVVKKLSKTINFYKGSMIVKRLAPDTVDVDGNTVILKTSNMYIKMIKIL